jgi:hypothetical protein
VSVLRGSREGEIAGVIRRRGGVSALMVLAFALSGCSADTEMFRADWKWWQRSSAPQAARGAGPDHLVGADGACPETIAPRGVALGMSECELVRSVGPTQDIQVGRNERGERTAVIVYQQGERAGRYRFVSGLLTEIEAVAPTAPPKPQKKPRQKKPPPRQNT